MSYNSRMDDDSADAGYTSEPEPRGPLCDVVCNEASYEREGDDTWRFLTDPDDRSLDMWSR